MITVMTLHTQYWTGPEMQVDLQNGFLAGSLGSRRVGKTDTVPLAKLALANPVSSRRLFQH